MSAVVHDETAAAPLHAPLSRLRLGEHTSLRPDGSILAGGGGAATAATSSSTATAGRGGGTATTTTSSTTTAATANTAGGGGRQGRARTREGFHGQAAFKQRAAAATATAAEAARLTVDEAVASAPIVAFVDGDGCDDSERVLALLREAGCGDSDTRLYVVRVDGGLAERLCSDENDDDDSGGGDGGDGVATAANAPSLASVVTAVGGDAAGRRAIRHALRYELQQRAGRAPIPAVLMAGVSGPPATASTGSFDGWAGGVEDLEALVAAGPGRLAARLMEAAWTFERCR